MTAIHSHNPVAHRGSFIRSKVLNRAIYTDQLSSLSDKEILLFHAECKDNIQEILETKELAKESGRYLNPYITKKLKILERFVSLTKTLRAASFQVVIAKDDKVMRQNKQLREWLDLAHSKAKCTEKLLITMFGDQWYEEFKLSLESEMATQLEQH